MGYAAVEKIRDNNRELYVYKMNFKGMKERYFAEYPLFKGCCGSGATKEQAIEEARENIYLHKWVGAMTSEKVDISSLK